MGDIIVVICIKTLYACLREAASETVVVLHQRCHWPVPGCRP